MDIVARFSAGFLQALAQSAPWLVIGYIVAGIIREWVPDQTLARWFRPGGAGIARAAGAGAMMPLCSCTVIPVGVGLARQGAGAGSVLTFLMTGPALSPVAILLFVTLLGPAMAILLVVGCLVGAVLTGLVADRLLPTQPRPTVVLERDERPWGQRVRAAGRWAWRDLAPEVSTDLVLGFALAAAALAFLPREWVGGWLSQPGIMTLILVLALAVPTYTCTVPSIPVVQSLILAGMTPGAGIAFLLAGPTTNLGELLVLRRALGARAMAVFVGGLVVTAVAVGTIADRWVFAATSAANLSATTAAGCCLPTWLPTSAGGPAGLSAVMAGIPLWHWPFVAVLLATLVVGLQQRWRRLRDKRNKSGNSEHANPFATVKAPAP